MRKSRSLSALTPAPPRSGISPVTSIACLPPPIVTTAMIEHVDEWIPTTLYQYGQCAETYGFPKETLDHDARKDHLACIMIPDEPSETPFEKLKQTIRCRFQEIEQLNERFDRLFLSVRRRRRHTIA